MQPRTGPNRTEPQQLRIGSQVCCISEESKSLELVGIEEVSFVQDNYDPAAVFMFLGGQRMHLVSVGWARPGGTRASHRVSSDARGQPPCPDGRVSEIDDGVAAGVDAPSAARTARVLPELVSPVTRPITRWSMCQVIRATASTWDRWIVGAEAVDGHCCSPCCCWG